MLYTSGLLKRRCEDRFRHKIAGGILSSLRITIKANKEINKEQKRKKKKNIKNIKIYYE